MRRIFEDIEWENVIEILFAIVCGICILAVLTLAVLIVLDGTGVIDIFTFANT